MILCSFVLFVIVYNLHQTTAIEPLPQLFAHRLINTQASIEALARHSTTSISQLLPHAALPHLADVFATFAELPDDPPVGTICKKELERLGQSVVGLAEGVAFDSYSGNVTLLVLDASGKPGAGFLRGNVVARGLQSECENIDFVDADGSQPFHGQLVTAQFTITIADMQRDFSWDLCVSAECDSEELEWILSRSFTINDTSVTLPLHQVLSLRDGSRINWQSWIVIGLLAGIGVLCALASIYDAFVRPQLRSLDFEEELAMQCFRAFSSYEHIATLMKTTDGTKRGDIAVLHALRFGSMCLVVGGHSITLVISFIDNPLDVIPAVAEVGGQILAHSYYAVDTFFFLGALLLGYLWFRQYDRDPRATTRPAAWILFYLHRIIRLSIPLFVVLVFFTFIYSPYLYTSITLAPAAYILDSCRYTWWHIMLYIQNYFMDDTCYTVAWYLGADMQMYIVAPVLLILPFLYSPRVGLMVAGALLAASTAVNVINVVQWRLPPSSFFLGWQDPKANKSKTLFVHWQYSAFWIRCQVYIMGFVVGYFMHKTPKLRMSKLVGIVGWATAIGVVAAITMTLRDWTLGHEMSLAARAAYSALNRVGWAAMLSWLVVACHYGYGGPIGAALNWPGWQPLGRLTYSAYLIHIMVLLQYMTFNYKTFVFTSVTQLFVVIVIPCIFYSYLTALIFSATIELPFARLEALIVGRLSGRGGKRLPSPQIVAPVPFDAVKAPPPPSTSPLTFNDSAWALDMPAASKTRI